MSGSRAARSGARLSMVSCGRSCRRPAASIRAAPTMPTRRWRAMAPCAAAGLRRAACAGAGPGTPAATTRYHEDGHAAAHPALHLQLLAADAVGGVGQAEPAQACADAARATGRARAARKPAEPRRKAGAALRRACGGAGCARRDHPRAHRPDRCRDRHARRDAQAGGAPAAQGIEGFRTNRWCCSVPTHHYEAQSGLAGEAGPNHRTLWQAAERANACSRRGAIRSKCGSRAPGKDGLEVAKVYTFKRDSYVIDVALELNNKGAGAAIDLYLLPAHP